MTLRLTSSSLAGMLRKLVAVGTSRLLAMLVAIAAAAPRIGWPDSSPAAAGVAAGAAADPTAGSAAGAGARVAAGGAGAGAAGGGAAGAGASTCFGAASPLPAGTALGRYPSKNSCHAGLTDSGSSRYCSYISSTSHELVPKRLLSDVV